MKTPFSNPDISIPVISVEMVERAIFKIDNNTASGHDSITIEHLKFAHPSVIVILSKLFCLFLEIGFVPSDFCLVITVPIPKFKGVQKNVSPEDFRGISLTPILSKVFEHCLLPHLSNLTTSDRQFGFKKGTGCLNVIHSVRKTVQYFNKGGNTVNLGLVDIRKAFDKTPPYGILKMLKIKGINRNIVKTLEFWLTNFSTSVRWGDCYSNQVPMSSGVRQGGVLSPLLFACYVDCLLVNLENSGLGCFVLKSCLNSFMYADDLILLSISVSDLQKMINLCNRTLEGLDLEINPMKSHCVRIGPRFKSICCSVFVNNVPLEWATSTKFLGVSILSANCFSCDWHDARSNFYKSLNTILGNLGVSPAVDVALNLIVSKCVPLLMYGLSAISISSSELNKLTFAYNRIFCKLFHVKGTETIKLCQFFHHHGNLNTCMISTDCVF